MAMTSQLRMLYISINENIQTRTSFVSVTAAFCEWVTGKYSFIFKPECTPVACVLPAR